MAIMPSADQVPINSTRSKMPWPMWVVLIAGSTGAALSAVRHAGVPGCDFAYAMREGEFLLAFVPRHHRPCHPGEFIGERDKNVSVYDVKDLARRFLILPPPMARSRLAPGSSKTSPARMS